MAHGYDSQLTKDAFTQYHIDQEDFSKPSSLLTGPALPALGHAISGSAGTAISSVAIYPLSLIVTRLQVQRQLQKEGKIHKVDDEEYKGLLDAVNKIHRQEGGLRAFYSGLAQDTTKSALDSFLFFLAYNFVRQKRRNAHGGARSLPIHEELLVGMVSGAFSKLLTTPVQNIVTRKQTASMSAVSSSPSVKSIIDDIKSEKGLAGFWSGYSATLVLTLNPAITFLLHETFQRALVPRSRRSDPGPRITFLLAALSKAIASTITYPFSLVKTRAQVSGHSANAEPADPFSREPKDPNDTIRHQAQVAASRAKARARRSVFAAVWQIAQNEGVGALYQGLGGEVLKGFFSHGLTMLMKERIHALVISLYYLLLKAMQRYPSPQELAEQAKARATEYARAMEGVAREGVDKGGELVSQGAQRSGALAEGVKSGTTMAVERGREILRESFQMGGGAVGDATDQAREIGQQGMRQAEEAMRKSGGTARGVVGGIKKEE